MAFTNSEKCPFCAQEMAENFKFCPNCAGPRKINSRLDDYELGRSAALESIKSDFFEWIVKRGSIIAISFTILAYLGFEKLIENTVSAKVDEEIDAMNKTIEEAHLSAKDADRQARKSASDTENILERTLSQQKMLSERINDLQVLLNTSGAAPAINKMMIDFYRIKAIYSVLEIEVDLPIRELERLSNFNAGVFTVMSIDYYSNEQNQDSPHIEMNVVDNITLIGDKNIHLKAYPFAPFEREYINSHISRLNGMTDIRIRVNSTIDSSQDDDMVSGTLKHIKSIKLAFYLNDTKIFGEDFSDIYIAVSDYTGDDGVAKRRSSVEKKISFPIGDMTSTYESRFVPFTQKLK